MTTQTAILLADHSRKSDLDGNGTDDLVISQPAFSSDPTVPTEVESQ